MRIFRNDSPLWRFVCLSNISIASSIWNNKSEMLKNFEKWFILFNCKSGKLQNLCDDFWNHILYFLFVLMWKSFNHSDIVKMFVAMLVCLLDLRTVCSPFFAGVRQGVDLQKKKWLLKPIYFIPRHQWKEYKVNVIRLTKEFLLCFCQQLQQMTFTMFFSTAQNIAINLHSSNK